MTGKVNNLTWQGRFGPGEVLFLGPTGQPRGFDDWEIAFHFVASPAISGLQIPTGAGHAGLKDSAGNYIAKAGHDYLWFQFKEKASGTLTQRSVIKRPVNAYVERVYDVGDFTLLGIG